MFHIGSIYIIMAYFYFSIAIPLMYILHKILYAIWSLNIDMHSHSKWKHTHTYFCFDCNWVDLVVLKCWSNISTQNFFLTNIPPHGCVSFSSTIVVCCVLVVLYDWPYPFHWGSARGRLWDQTALVWKWRKSVEQWSVKQEHTPLKRRKKKYIKHILCCVPCIVICTCVMVWARAAGFGNEQ